MSNHQGSVEGHTAERWAFKNEVLRANAHAEQKWNEAVVVGGEASNEIVALAFGYSPEGCHRRARLIAAAPDHALICWAMCVQDGRWEEWSDGKGEFIYAGLRHATSLDEFGAPVLTANLRARITEDRAQAALSKATPNE